MYSDRWMVAILVVILVVFVGAEFSQNREAAAKANQGIMVTRLVLATPIAIFSLVMVLWSFVAGESIERVAGWLSVLFATEMVGSNNAGAALGLALIVTVGLVRPILNRGKSGDEPAPTPNLNPHPVATKGAE